MKMYVAPKMTCVELRLEEKISISCLAGSCVDYEKLASDQVASCLLYTAATNS